MLFQDRHCDGGSKRAKASVCLQAFISAVPRGCVNIHTSLTNAADPAATGSTLPRLWQITNRSSAFKGNERERNYWLFFYNLSECCKIVDVQYFSRNS